MAVAESAGDAIICLNRTDNIYFWNKKAEEIFGYSAGEAIGKFLHQLIVPERFRSDAYKGLDYFSRSGIGSIVGKQLEITALRKDGTEFPVELSVSAIKVGDDWHAIGIIRDITERKEAAAIKVSENRYRSLFENMQDGLAYCKMLFDDNGHPEDFVYLNVNAAFERLTGLKNVVGKKVTEVIPGIKESHPELFDIYGRVALTGKAERFEIELKPLAIWLTISAYSTEKGYFAAVFDNITLRKKAEEKFKNYISELERFKKATIQREFRIKELKERLERLEKK